jgi:DNA processing protein
MNNSLLYQIALTLVPRIGPVQARLLVDHVGDAEQIFKEKKQVLEKIEGIGQAKAFSIKAFKDLKLAEEEIKFLEKFKITALFLKDKNYPKRLLNCYDPPTLLYYKGKADLNVSRTIAIVGTRSKTDYGKHVTELLIKELKDANISVISGLALGIDTVAHKAAIKNSIPTVAVLGHGLDKIYPSENAGLARNIIAEGGGLLTEFRHKTKPDKHNFPTRNRIVAGMCDAIIVTETDIKGGSMITAELANSYNKDVFAFPGKTTDNKSAGCNFLIKSNKAMLLTDANQMMEVMGWSESTTKRQKKQTELFVDLSTDEKRMMELLQDKKGVHIDELNIKSGISTSGIAIALLNLELQGLVKSLPGKIYAII